MAEAIANQPPWATKVGSVISAISMSVVFLAGAAVIATLAVKGIVAIW